MIYDNSGITQFFYNLEREYSYLSWLQSQNPAISLTTGKIVKSKRLKKRRNKNGGGYAKFQRMVELKMLH